MNHQMLRPFIIKVSVLGVHFPLSSHYVESYHKKVAKIRIY